MLGRKFLPPMGPVLVEPADKYPDDGVKIACWLYLHPSGYSVVIPENIDELNDETDLNGHMRDDFYNIIENEHNDPRLVEQMKANGWVLSYDCVAGENSQGGGP